MLTECCSIQLWGLPTTIYLDISLTDNMTVETGQHFLLYHLQQHWPKVMNDWLKVFHWGQGLWFHQVLAGNETVVTCQWVNTIHSNNNGCDTKISFYFLFLFPVGNRKKQSLIFSFFLERTFFFRTNVNPQNCTTIIQNMTHMILLWSSPLVYGWVRGLK